MNSSQVSDFLPILKESIGLLLKNPILFLPKIIIALLYGLGTLVSVYLVQKLILFYGASQGSVDLSDLQNWLYLSIALIVLVVVSYFLDLFFSGLYPLLVNQAIKGKVSFRNAFLESKKELVSLFAAGIVLWVFIFIISLIESVIITVLNFSTLGLAASLVLTFALTFLLYFLFPIIILKRKGVLFSIKDSLKESFSNKKKVFVFSLIPFSISLIKIGVAFFTVSQGLMVLFWILVLLTGIVYAIHAVANQILYLKLVLSKKN